MNRTSTLKMIVCTLALAGPTCGTISAAEPPSTITQPIAAQPLASALNEFVTRTGMQVVYRSEIAEGVRSKGAASGVPPQKALEQLLQDTGLRFEFINPTTVAIRYAQDSMPAAANKAAAPIAAAGEDLEAMRLAQTQRPASESAPSSGERVSRNGATAGDAQEILVTGTHIREQQPTGTHLIVIGREAIAKQGFSTAAQVVQSLPQNFAGEVREDLNGITGRNSAGGVTAGVLSNSSQATGVNLRGAGPDGTLVLLNGRRLAPSGSQSNFTDISNIPASAIERVEVLPDGASALYGSDAIGGVVNFVLRENYEGAETLLRAGGATSGGLDERQVSQTFGRSWAGGNGLLVAEYYSRDSLGAADRRRATASDLRDRGGGDFSVINCNPGTVVVGATRYAIPLNQNGTGLTPASFSANTSNRCDTTGFADVFPNVERWSLFGSIEHDFTSRFKVFMDGSYNSRDNRSANNRRATFLVPTTNAFFVNPTGANTPVVLNYDFTGDLGIAMSNLDVESYSFAAGMEATLGFDWKITGYGAYARETVEQTSDLSPDTTLLASLLASNSTAVAFNPFAAGSNTSAATLAALRDSRISTGDLQSQTRSATVVADGPLLSLPGGRVHAAIGAEVRKQLYDNDTAEFLKSLAAPRLTHSDAERSTRAAFAELMVPIFGESNAVSGLKRLELSGAVRHERYSDFGTTTVPRFGLTWAPTETLSVRGTVSRSFKAPAISTRDQSANQVIVLNLADTLGATPSILVFGNGNVSLQPEEAKAWTAGMDFDPAQLPGLSLNLTYFHIDDAGRVQGLPSTNYLTDPANTAAVIRNPTPAQRLDACGAGIFLANVSSAPGACAVAATGAIVDSRIRNLGKLIIEGVDVSASYDLTQGANAFTVGLSATYLDQYRVQLTPTSSILERVDTPGSPLRFKTRGFVSWTAGNVFVHTAVNYTGSYTDIFSVPQREIDSYLTVDLNLGYSLPMNSGLLGGMSAALTVRDLFDSEPPFYNNTSGFAYDAQNFDISGRTLALTLRKTW